MIGSAISKRLYAQSVRDDLAVGNLAGIQYAEAKAARDQFELRLAKLEEDHKKLQEDHQRLQKTHQNVLLFCSSLQNEVRDLKESVEDYKLFVIALSLSLKETSSVLRPRMTLI